MASSAMTGRSCAASPPGESYYDLGSFHRSVSTSSDDAQTWFDRGLIWNYAFNHEESAKCFERAIASDNSCAMACWGLAYSLGPNYNKPWAFFDEREREVTVKRAHRAVQQAKAITATARPTPIEQALIEALQFRYPQQQSAATGCDEWNVAYAEAMRSVYQRFADDLDVATLYADALMNLTPWNLWDLRSGEPAPGARTLEAQNVLNRAMAQNGGHAHPGLLHLYIHLMEMSGVPSWP